MTADTTPHIIDWRTEYVICEHVANDERQGTHHRGFRACCEACAPAFLTVERITVEERDVPCEVAPRHTVRLCIGRI